MKSSNIGGQAVMEGIMMRHKDVYSIAVRKPDKEIEIKVEDYKSIMKWKPLLKIPILRGVFNFIDSLVVGTKCLMYSATFFEEEEDLEKRKALEGEEREREEAKKEKQDKLLMTGTVIFSIIFSCSVIHGIALSHCQSFAEGRGNRDYDYHSRGSSTDLSVSGLSSFDFQNGGYPAGIYVSWS